jgi:arylsulfatase A-like enzyme
MAAEGLRFTRAYAGAPVCAPLRCNLMTGKHAGHASVRANDGGTPLRADEATIASVLKARGYATGGFGKWGCGGRGSTGVPEAHGFDEFFGYYDQVHAHSYFPPYLVRNSAEVELPGNVGGAPGDSSGVPGGTTMRRRQESGSCWRRASIAVANRSKSPRWSRAMVATT